MRQNDKQLFCSVLNETSSADQLPFPGKSCTSICLCWSCLPFEMTFEVGHAEDPSLPRDCVCSFLSSFCKGLFCPGTLKGEKHPHAIYLFVFLISPAAPPLNKPPDWSPGTRSDLSPGSKNNPFYRPINQALNRAIKSLKLSSYKQHVYKPW